VTKRKRGSNCHVDDCGTSVQISTSETLVPTLSVSLWVILRDYFTC
jgi:hypothetical protein